jgi:transposase
LVKLLRKDGADLKFCYEAGPCGYGIHRQLDELGWECQVVAPSLIPKKSGDRVKIDRRDSLLLARLHRAAELTAVWVRVWHDALLLIEQSCRPIGSSDMLLEQGP